MCIALCTIVAHNIAQNRADNFPSYPPDNHHCSDDVYLREGGFRAGIDCWYRRTPESDATWPAVLASQAPTDRVDCMFSLTSDELTVQCKVINSSRLASLRCVLQRLPVAKVTGTRGNAVPGPLKIAGERSRGRTQPLMVRAG